MNKQYEIKTEQLRLAGLKYYSKENNGIEVGETLSYAFLLEIDGKYINVFDIIEELPVFRRVPYYNMTLDGEDYGTKVRLENGINKTGPCYVLLSEDMRNVFQADTISFEKLEKYVLNSELFYKDRISIARKRINKNPLGMMKIIHKDKIKHEKLEEYFEKRDVKLQKVR